MRSSLSKGYFTESSAEYDALYGVYFHDQQHPLVSGLNYASNQASSSGYAEDWFLPQEF